jgi:hypothetical protein
MTDPVEPPAVAPDATAASSSVLKPRLRPYILDWMAEQKAKAEASPGKAAQAEQQRQAMRALGLAWIDPERLDEYAVEAGVQPELMRKALTTEEGQRLATSAASKLRASGEASQVQVARITESLLALIEQGVADGTVSAAAAPKIIDSISKLRGTAESRNAKSPDAASVGSLAGLIGL